MQQKKLSFGEKVAYGFGDVGCNVLWALTASVTTYFYTNVMGISAATVGIVLLLSRCFDGFSDAIIGILVDRTKSKHGKARAWVLWMIAPFGLACILLFMVPANATEIVKAVYVFLTYNFTVTVVYTALNLPYETMASLISGDDNGSYLFLGLPRTRKSACCGKRTGSTAQKKHRRGIPKQILDYCGVYLHHVGRLCSD